MLAKIFDTNNVVLRFFGKLGYIWWLHILWLICSLPVITLGASTTALLYGCMKLDDKEGSVTKNFFHSFRENFRQSTILFLFFLITGSLLLADIILCSGMESVAGKFVRYGALALLIPYCMTLLYTFAVQAKFVNPIKKTLQYAFWLAGKHFGYTLQMFLIAAAVLLLNTTIVLANYVTLSIGVGVEAYILSLYYRKIFAHYI